MVLLKNKVTVSLILVLALAAVVAGVVVDSPRVSLAGVVVVVVVLVWKDL